MATHRRKANRPSIKSKIKKLPLGKIDWSNSDRNASTLPKGATEPLPREFKQYIDQ